MRAALQSLLHLKDPPHRTALAFGAGVFIAFSPLFGLHTVMAIAVAFALRLNRVAILAGAWINVWALAPCYAFGTWMGAMLLGVDASDVKNIEWTLKGMGSTMSTLFWPIMLGNTLLGLIAAGPAYALCRKFLESRARRSHADETPPPAKG